MSLGVGLPNASLFAQLQFPQDDLMNAAQGVPPFALPMLLSGYGQVVGQSPLQASAFIPPFLSMPAPAAMLGVMQPIAGAGYARAGGLAPYSNEAWLGNLFGGDQSREGARMERVLRSDPFARAAFEQAIGGRIIDFGREGDGRIAVQRMGVNPYAQALGGGALSPIASQLGGLYQQMNEGVGMARNGGLLGQSPFEALALSGFANMANQLIAAAGGGGGVSGMPPLFGTGQGSWNPQAAPGKIQGTSPAKEGNHSAQVSSILNDPSLTMEDKIMLALMCICEKMDEDIKRQTEYLNKLQNQQGGGKKGGGGKSGEKSIDIETKKLERMIQKRSQLFDTLSKIMERYDQSAKNVIQSMRG